MFCLRELAKILMGYENYFTNSCKEQTYSLSGGYVISTSLDSGYVSNVGISCILASKPQLSSL
jgi:hypothetical protein